MNKRKLCNLFKEVLMDGVVPFWYQYGVDTEYGGVLSCMTEDGKRISEDKYIWSQARFVWTLSALYNRIDKQRRFLDTARATIEFLLAHGRDPQGRWVYHTTRTGDVIEGPISIYSDLFAVYGFSEYYRAVPEHKVKQAALSTLEIACRRIEEPDFHETAPYELPPGQRTHGVPMILTEVTNELAQTTGDADIENLADEYAARVMNHFVRPHRKLLLENLDRNYHELPPPRGTFVNPGHAIESMWFIMHLARRRNNPDLVARAAEVMRWHLEAGWDKEYGGIFLGIDAEGGEPYLPHSEKKLWWPHTEAIYGLLLAHELTREKWCAQWFGKVYEWAMAHYPMPDVGEWMQRLNRRGEPVTEVIALPVKDPFHLPRALILSIQLLEAV
jgi:N-acylglucosamine 2-epimerase